MMTDSDMLQDSHVDDAETQSVEQAADTVEHDLNDLIGNLSRERDELQSQLLRAAADFQNFRRRAHQEKDQMRLLALEGFASDLLGVVDNFERTLSAVESGASVESIVEGVGLINKQLLNALAQHQVTRIEALGQPFDPELHEAIEREPSSEVPPNTVTAELQAGYRLGNRVIRPARVKVSVQQ
ncbi:MAG TPA: nucleotide exchange factor GrpE [Fimbriimonadaceae bacterium]|nr:nucleotide exchange factor GrpE [Fimbriimonadaceae bacterium]